MLNLPITQLKLNYPANDVCINIIYMEISTLNYGREARAEGRGLIMCKIDLWEKYLIEQRGRGRWSLMDSRRTQAEKVLSWMEKTFFPISLVPIMKKGASALKKIYIFAAIFRMGI